MPELMNSYYALPLGPNKRQSGTGDDTKKARGGIQNAPPHSDMFDIQIANVRDR